MFMNFFSTEFKVLQQPNADAAAADTNDEEIAFQLQLEAIAESFHHQSRPKSRPSSSFQDGASPSGTQAVPYLGTPGRYSGASDPTRPMNDSSSESMLGFGGLPRSMNDSESELGFGGPTRPMNESESMRRIERMLLHWYGGQKPRETADKDGAEDGTTSVSARVGEDPILEMECVICTEMRSYTSFMSTTGCTHEYCFYCLQHYAEEKIASGSAQIQCPHDGCSQDFSVHQCLELLSQASYEILTTRQTEAAIPSSLKVYCPFKDCSAFMENCSASNGGRGSCFVECWACNRGFCVKCSTPWHANLTCSQYRADVENRNRSGDEKLRDLAEKEKWQSCRECKRVIELKEGCYHMTCLCGNEFCYVCGAKWKNKVATCKCKLWDESNIIRPRMRL